MGNKYYTPEISEFCVGFEYERFIPKSNHTEEECWEKVTMSLNYLTLDEIEDEFIEKEIRVKYLDEQDILDCGFEKLSGDSNKITFKSINSSAGIYFYPDDRRKVLVYIDIYDYEGCIFDGYIKNKTELIKLLKQLGI